MMYTQADVDNIDQLINSLRRYKVNMQKCIKALDATFNNGKLLNRVGVRGGRATSLMAKQYRIYDVMIAQEEEIANHIDSFFMKLK